MIKRILIVWAIANFGLIGLPSFVLGGWYLGWDVSPIVKLLAELGLIMLPNLLLPVLVLRTWDHLNVDRLRDVLGWKWHGWRSILIGLLAFGFYDLLVWISSRFLGESIPYQLPQSSANSGIVISKLSDVFMVLGILIGLGVFLVLSVIGEETMFRGWIQGQLGRQYGPWLGVFGGALLFGLRHLPADWFYAQIWHATPQMWLSRQVQLYLFAIILGLVRHYDRSTYAPAIMHAIVFSLNLFGLG